MNPSGRAHPRNKRIITEKWAADPQWLPASASECSRASRGVVIEPNAMTYRLRSSRRAPWPSWTPEPPPRPRTCTHRSWKGSPSRERRSSRWNSIPARNSRDSVSTWMANASEPNQVQIIHVDNEYLGKSVFSHLKKKERLFQFFSFSFLFLYSSSFRFFTFMLEWRLIFPPAGTWKQFLINFQRIPPFNFSRSAAPPRSGQCQPVAVPARTPLNGSQSDFEFWISISRTFHISRIKTPSAISFHSAAERVRQTVPSVPKIRFALFKLLINN